MTAHRLRQFSIATIIGLGMIFVASVSRAQSVKVRGVIDGRNGPTMSLQTDTGKVVVMLTPDTQAEDVAGVFHARRKQVALTALVPGLTVEVEGNYNGNNQLVADTVKFKASNLQAAVDIQAGVAPVEQQEQQQQQQLQQEQKQINAEQKEQAAQAEKIAANKVAIAAVNKRFGELADYNIWDEATVYFGNGQVKVDPEYDSKLLALAAKALTGVDPSAETTE